MFVAVAVPNLNLAEPRLYLLRRPSSQTPTHDTRHYRLQDGDQRRCKAVEGHEVPYRIQSEGGHAKGQSGGHEEVRLQFLRAQVPVPDLY